MLLAKTTSVNRLPEEPKEPVQTNQGNLEKFLNLVGREVVCYRPPNPASEISRAASLVFWIESNLARVS